MHVMMLLSWLLIIPVYIFGWSKGKIPNEEIDWL